jgi:membrane associated rhomboid family serine protease
VIPLRDTIRSRTFPFVNLAIIGINVVVFLFENALHMEGQSQLFSLFGLIPAQFWQESGLDRWIPLFTSMFLHAGWWHLLSNMIALYIFGDNIEDTLGHIWYPVFYVAAGLAAGGAHVLTNANSSVPTVGASGAIAGVLGAYLILFPRSRILTLVPIFYFLRLIEIPAVVYLGFWFVSQLFNGLFALQAANTVQTGGVAWWAHIGGFVFGLLVAFLVPRLSPGVGGQEWPWERRA